MEPQVRVGVGLYILNENNQLLLGLRKSPHGNGTWCPPGGHLEFGESFEQAAVRETSEETGIAIAPETVKIANFTNDIYRHENKHYVTIQLTTRIKNAEPRVMEPDKCREWKWFDLNNLPENLFLSSANFLKDHPLG